MSSRGAAMKAWTSAVSIGGRILWPPPQRGALCSARRDRQRALARVHALGADRRALRLGELRQAELAHDAVALELVEHLPGERRAAAGRAAVAVAAAAAGVAAEDLCEVGGHGVVVRGGGRDPSRGSSLRGGDPSRSARAD